MSIKRFFNKIKTNIIDMLYPKNIKCIFCGDELKDKNIFNTCPDCHKSLPLLVKDICLRCGQQLSTDDKAVCKNCKQHNFNFEYARAVFRYEDKLSKSIHTLKYSNGLYLVEPFANYMINILSNQDWEIDYITYVPLHPNREKQRGYNQAKELASIISKSINIPMIDCFKRVIDNPSQTEMSGKERIDNVKNIFKLIDHNTKNKNILIIDDIFTTGATVNELAKLLKNGQAEHIYVLTLAHSSLKESY